MFAAPASNPYNAKFYGAAAISQALGGGDWMSEGCGKCWKVTGTSNIAGYDTGTTTTVVLKGTNYCPPANPACANGNPHFDIAAPAFDYEGASIWNSCAEREPDEVDAFKSCGRWMIDSSNPNDNCDCSLFSNPVLKAGCENFKSLYWNNPSVTYEEVTCPPELSQLPCWAENGDNYPWGGPPDLCMDPNAVVSPTEPTPTASPVASPVASPSTPSGPTEDGVATFYGGNVAGNACGFIDLPTVSFPYGLASAAGGDNFDDGYGCGGCFEITCTGKAKCCA